MLTASELRPGMALRIDGTLYKIVDADYHGGQGKMGGVAHAKLRNVETGTMREWRFRSGELLEPLVPERRDMQFLYKDAQASYFMDPDSFEQVPIDTLRLGRAEIFLTEGTIVPVEFIDAVPIGIVFPDIVEMRVADTTPAVHSQGPTNVWKQATLDNGLRIMVPPFIAPGETIRVEVERGVYVERAKKK